MKKFLRFSLCFILLTCVTGFISNSQTPHDYGFEKTWSVEVRDLDNNVLDHPWLGGLNACQFVETDLNLDGIKDLVVFDRCGSRILPFLNHGAAGNPDYTYATRYISKFPAIHDWMNLKDYNCDGKEDLFTFDFGGISVYKNVSDTALRFELEVLQLLSYQGAGYINIWVTPADYPVIDDLDGDGDLDILSFYILGGNYVQLHRNLSVEKYESCDSLDYLMSMCYGYFFEGSSSNAITLNAPCPFDQPEPPVPASPAVSKDILHVGSTMLSLDLNGDGLKDLLIGDVTYPGLIALYNGGTQDSAHMVSQDTSFPSNSVPVNLVSFPLPTYMDVNNDGKNEILVSPFDPNPVLEQNEESVWLYQNTGTVSAPVFELLKKDFLQGDMIDVGGGAYPVFFDYDNDGLTDVVVANYGNLDSSWLEFGNLYCLYRSRLALYKNTGTLTAPSFKLITSDMAGILALNIRGAYPAFGDIDGDEVPEMLTGMENGQLLLFENTAGPGQAAEFVLSQAAYQGIDAGTFSTPQLVDLDRDSLLDLVVGNQEGSLWYYRNTGTENSPVFTLVTESLGGVDVRDTLVSWDGYSVPCFFGDSGKYKLFAGSMGGYVSYYKDIDNNLGGDFTLAEQRLFYFDEGERSGVAVADLDHDTLFDMLIGNFSGGLGYFKGIHAGNNNLPEDLRHALQIRLFPNPAKESLQLMIDGMIPNQSCMITVTDLPGRTVLTDKQFYPGEKTLNVSSLKPGVYVLEVRRNGQGTIGLGVGRTKFIKE